MFSAFNTFGRLGLSGGSKSPPPAETELQADDGTTPLHADDGTTTLTED